MTDAPEYMHFQPCPDGGWEDPQRSNSSGTKYVHEDEFKDLEAERDKLLAVMKSSSKALGIAQGYVELVQTALGETEK